VAGEFLVGPRKEVVALCLVLADKQDVGRVAVVREHGPLPLERAKRPKWPPSGPTSPGQRPYRSVASGGFGVDVQGDRLAYERGFHAVVELVTGDVYVAHRGPHIGMAEQPLQPATYAVAARQRVA
jgi:hypothetical protein